MEVAMIQLLRRLTSITRRNPLRRRVDRVQNALLIALIALLLGATPFLTAASGHWARVTGRQELRSEQAWHQVTATITHSAPQRRAPWPVAGLPFGRRPAGLPPQLHPGAYMASGT
jgi:hypothetical protein